MAATFRASEDHLQASGDHTSRCLGDGSRHYFYSVAVECTGASRECHAVDLAARRKHHPRMPGPFGTSLLGHVLVGGL